MAKVISDGFLDAFLDVVSTCTTMTLCAGFPTSYADIADRELGSTTIDETDFEIDDGVINGRRVTVASQQITIDTSGVWDHLVIDDGENYIVTTTARVALVANGLNYAITPAFDYEIADAT